MIKKIISEVVNEKEDKKLTHLKDYFIGKHFLYKRGDIVGGYRIVNIIPLDNSYSGDYMVQTHKEDQITDETTIMSKTHPLDKIYQMGKNYFNVEFDFE